jgi:hypothetical protein
MAFLDEGIPDAPSLDAMSLHEGPNTVGMHADSGRNFGATQTFIPIAPTNLIHPYSLKRSPTGHLWPAVLKRGRHGIKGIVLQETPPSQLGNESAKIIDSRYDENVTRPSAPASGLVCVDPASLEKELDLVKRSPLRVREGDLPAPTPDSGRTLTIEEASDVPPVHTVKLTVRGG